MITLSRAITTLCVVFALSACGGGGGGGNPIFNPIANAACDPGASVAITRPQSGSFGVPANIGSIEIDLSSNSNPVWNNSGSWTLGLQPTNGQILEVNGTFTPVNDNGGPHPFANDFYLSENIPQLSPGTQYNVYLQQTSSGCTPVQIGQFST